jgi:hypothetical protein
MKKSRAQLGPPPPPATAPCNAAKQTWTDVIKASVIPIQATYAASFTAASTEMNRTKTENNALQIDINTAMKIGMI